MTRAAKHTPEWLAYGLYAAITLAIMLPLCKPGFVLTLDMVFTPTLRMPDGITSSYLLHVFLHFLGLIMPADIVTKLLLFGVLIGGTIGMHRLIRNYIPRSTDQEWGLYIGSIFFAINPFTYSRFMAGQYSVLLGYALLPWFTRQLIAFGREPYRANALKLGGWAALIGIVSIHTLGEVAIITAVAIVIACWQYRSQLYGYIRYGAVALGLCIVLSSYWLIPLAVGHSKTNTIVQSFTAADSQAFATTGGSTIGKLGNILRLQGFWAENRGLYLLPQDRVVAWGLMALVVLAVVSVGTVAMWRVRPASVVLFGASSVIAVVLALGFLQPWLSAIGYREPHKFIGLLAMTYALFLACGVSAVLHRVQAKGMAIYATTTVALCAIPLMLTRVMFWGFDGQLVPRHYPASWQAINNQLDQDPSGGRVLALPWHQYMSYRFAGRIIANPAASYFDRDTIVSQDPELGGASSGEQDAAHQAIGHALQAQIGSKEFSRQLADLHIKYVLLAKELDYRQYDAIVHSPAFRLVADHPDIALYQNTAWRNK